MAVLIVAGCAIPCQFHQDNPNASVIEYQLHSLCEGGYHDACDALYDMRNKKNK